MLSLNDNLTLELPTLEATTKFASNLAKCMTPGLIIFLHGDLGAGKTTFVRSLLLAMGHVGAVKSPTYTLVESYQLGDLKIEHFDLYRLSDPAELEYIGIRDYVTPNSICFFEWAEKGHGHIPTADLDITLDFTIQGRKGSLVANTAAGKKIIANIKKNDNHAT